MIVKTTINKEIDEDALNRFKDVPCSNGFLYEALYVRDDNASIEFVLVASNEGGCRTLGSMEIHKSGNVTSIIEGCAQNILYKSELIKTYCKDMGFKY